MKFTRERPDGIYSFHASGDREVTINSPSPSDPRDQDGHVVLHHSFILRPQKLMQNWRPRQLAQLQTEDLDILETETLEVLLIGTGASMQLPGREQMALLAGLGVGYELMDTAAACRTYNVLAAEGRRVVAAIML